MGRTFHPNSPIPQNRTAFIEETSKNSKDSILQSTDGVFEASFVRQASCHPQIFSFNKLRSSFQTTEEATVILSDMLSSPRKRKRVAGFWDDVELDLPELEVKKRARVDITSYIDDVPKENIAPTKSHSTEVGGTDE